MVVQGFSEKSRLKIMDELGRFITVDKHEAVQVGDLERNVESRPAVEAEVHGRFSCSVVREGAEELTLRREKESALRTSIDSTDVGDSKREPPLVNEDWHAMCQATFQGVEGPEWDRGQKNKISRFGQRAADPIKIPSTAGSLGNPLEEPNVRSGRRTETYRGLSACPVISMERCVMCLGSVPESEALGSHYHLAWASGANYACWK